MNATATYTPMTTVNFVEHAVTGIALVSLWYWCLCSASVMDGRYDHVPWICRPMAMAGCGFCFKKQTRVEESDVYHQINLV